jgi:hypothetical protein
MSFALTKDKIGQVTILIEKSSVLIVRSILHVNTVLPLTTLDEGLLQML